jgi:hypothetical protein
MSSKAAFDAIKGTLDTYAADPGALPVRYENEFVQDLLDANTAAWLYVEVYGDFFDQASIGAEPVTANRWREGGVVFLHVMVPSGSGSGLARGYAGELLELFQGQEIDGVRFRDASIGEGEPGRDFPNYWAMAASIEWERDTA